MNTYSGDTFINAGSLQFNQGGSANNSTIRLGDTTGTATATLSITDADGGTTIGSFINVRTGSSGTKTISGTNTSGTNTFSGLVAYDAAATVSSDNAGGTLAFTGATFELKTFAGTFTGSGDTTVSNVISSTSTAGTLTKTGAGRLTLSGANTYTGTTTISGGILRLSGGAAIADAGVIANIAQGGLLDLNVSNETIAAITAAPGSISLAPLGALTTNALTISGAGNSSLTGLVYGTGGSLVKSGAGTLALATAQGSANSFSSGNLFSGGLTIASGSGAVTISTVNASGTGLITTASALNISAAQLLNTGGINVNGGTTTLSAIDSGGLGTVTLNTGGTLTIATVSTGTRLANVVLNAGGTFNPFTSVQFGTLAGSLGFTAQAGTLTFGGNNGTATYTGNIAGAVASNISKVGSGTQILNGTNATTGTITANGSGGTLEIGGQFTGNTGAVAVNAGTLRLNFNAATAPATNLLNPASTLTAAGGILAIAGKDTVATSQAFASTTLTAGTASNISVVNGTGASTTALNLGGLTRNAGSAVNFTLPSGAQSATNGILTTSPSGGGGALLVPTNNTAYATVGGTGFAAKDATNAFIVPLTGSVAATGGASLTGTATDNADISSASVSTTGASTINTARFNNAAGSTVTLGGALTVTAGGILVSSAVTGAGSRITGGSITAGSGGTAATTAEVVIHQNSAQPFTLNSPIVNSTVTGAGGVILTKTGPGTLILTAGNSNSGLTYVASGTLQIGTGGNVGGNSVLSLAPNDPTAVFDVNNQTTTVGNLSGGGNTGGYVNLGASGTLNDTSNNSSTYSGALVGGVNSVINKTGGAQGIQGQNQAFYGTLNIATGSSIGIFGNNGFINATVNVNTGGSINQGGSGTTVQLGNLGGTGGTLTAGSNTGAGGTYQIGYLGGASSYAGVIANGTFAGTPGLTNLVKFGSGTTTLSGANTYSGTTTINSGTLLLNYATGSDVIAAATPGTFVVGGGQAIFRGGTVVARNTDTTGIFGIANNVFSRVTLDANGGTGFTAILGTNATSSFTGGPNNSLLIDTSSSAGNVVQSSTVIAAADGTATNVIRTQNGLLAAVGGTASINGYRANVFVRDSTGIGFATNNGTTTTISRYTGATLLTAADTGNALSDTANYRLATNLTRTAQFQYNTLELDSSTQAVTLTDNSTTPGRFGDGNGTVQSSRAILATGTNGATLTSINFTNQPFYLNNYQTGSTVAGQTLTVDIVTTNALFVNGTRPDGSANLIVATKTPTGDIYAQSGVFRLAPTVPTATGDALVNNTGVIRLVGGIFEIGADLTGSASPTSTADFSRSVGGSAGQVLLLGDTGFSAFGGNRTVNLGGAGQQLLWGNDNFLASTAGGTTEGNNTFRLSSAYSDSQVDFQNPIALGNITRQVDVANGSAAVDARLSGVLSGVFAPTVTLANSAPAITNAAAGLTKLGAGTLEVTAANTYIGRTTVSAGTLSVDNNGTTTPRLAGTSQVVVNSGGTLLLSSSNGSSTDRINDAAAVTLAGGKFDTGGFQEGKTTTGVATTGVGALTLSASSTIDFGVGSSSVLAFANSSGAVWGPSLTLSILNWNGIPDTGGGTEALFFGTTMGGLTGFQLAEIQFVNPAGFSGIYSAGINSNGEVFAATPIPEPASFVGALSLLGLIGWRERRRVGRALGRW